VLTWCERQAAGKKNEFRKFDPDLISRVDARSVLAGKQRMGARFLFVQRNLGRRVASLPNFAVLLTHP
jgi:hypothetical protein